MSYFYRYARDPVSSMTHYIGMWGAAVGCILMLWRGIALDTDTLRLLCCVVFGVSLIGLYGASTLYHFYRGSDKVLLRLRKLDHSLIYVLIAGSYTPFAFHCMEPAHAAMFLGKMWVAAIIGIAVKLCWLNAPRWLYTSIYLLMGWAVIFDFSAFRTLGAEMLSLVAAGGISYSVGAVFYLVKRPRQINGIGFHEIFHIFIMIGSLLHFIAVFFYIL